MKIVLPPQSQRLFLIDPKYFWIHFNPEMLLMSANDFALSNKRRGQSSYDFLVQSAASRLRKNNVLRIYQEGKILSKEAKKKIKKRSNIILKKLVKYSLYKLVEDCVLIWQDYVHYLGATALLPLAMVPRFTPESIIGRVYAQVAIRFT